MYQQHIPMVLQVLHASGHSQNSAFLEYNMAVCTLALNEDYIMSEKPISQEPKDNLEPNVSWHALTPEEVLSKLHVELERGLSTEEATTGWNASAPTNW